MMTHKILNRDPKDQILKAFRPFDDDQTGKISFKNLKRVAKELGERMTDEELQEMIDEADRDGDGEVNEEEFLRIMKRPTSSDCLNRFLHFNLASCRCRSVKCCTPFLRMSLEFCKRVRAHNWT